MKDRKKGKKRKEKKKKKKLFLFENRGKTLHTLRV